MNKLSETLKSNSYPGRGIVLGRSEDGKSAVIAYFTMGRSINSRNRIFVATADGVENKAFDESKMTDPSLIIYAPVRMINGINIVTNGDQTDTIYEYMSKGRTFEEALRTRTFEPDAPNYTPRISGIMDGEGNYRLSILKAGNGNSSKLQRFFHEYTGALPGEGHFIHTYKGDGNPIPSFEGEPEAVDLRGNIDEFTSLVWENLNFDNKVSLFVRFIDLESKRQEDRIVNKNIN